MTRLLGASKRSISISSGLVCLALLGWGLSAHAEQPAADPSIAALAAFANGVGAGTAASAFPTIVDLATADRPSRVTVSAPDDDTHSGVRSQASAAQDDYEALLDFANRNAPPAANAMTLSDVRTAVFGDNAIIDPSEQIRVAEAAKPKQAKAAPRAQLPDGGGTYVGSDKCVKCHAASVESYSKTLMGRIAKTQRGKLDCESCHGPGSLHVAAGGGRGVGGMNPFKPTTPEQVERDNGLCLACHERGGRTAWHGSTHENRGLACSSCHSVMSNKTPKAQLAKATEQEVCYQCHKLQRAQMQRSSHMPVREGKMTCSNCHNPHGSVYGTEAMLREASVNDNCYKCHADKRGPLLHEHAPVRENCLNCHESHGSNHEYLLKVQRPRLCAECHAFAHGGQAGFNKNSVFAFGHGCVNCHAQVHGSNHPSGTFFLR